MARSSLEWAVSSRGPFMQDRLPDNPAITVILNRERGHVFPFQEIDGIHNPSGATPNSTNRGRGIALDASGAIYVTNTAYPSITVYAANPSGTLNETPLEEIFGSDARLSSPIGITVH